jgi:hypothetical protein
MQLYFRTLFTLLFLFKQARLATVPKHFFRAAAMPSSIPHFQRLLDAVGRILTFYSHNMWWLLPGYSQRVGVFGIDFTPKKHKMWATSEAPYYILWLTASMPLLLSYPHHYLLGVPPPAGICCGNWGSGFFNKSIISLSTCLIL